MKFDCALAISSLTLALGCHGIESGVDPEPLGYGLGPHLTLASGYDPDPVPRATPTPWTPPERMQPTLMSLGGSSSPSPGSSSAGALPVAYSAEVIRICEHVATLTGSDNPAEAAACKRSYRVARVFRVIGQWNTLAACVEAAPSPADVAACEQASPPVFGGVIDAHPRESAVCMHVFALTLIEQLGPEPMLDTARLGEFEPMLDECVDSLVSEGREDLAPSSYVQMLECIENAQTTEVAEACE